MNLYLDTSAVVKQYIMEAGTADIASVIRQAKYVGTCLITRPETSAAIGKATRIGWLDRPTAEKVRGAFQANWADLIVIQLTLNVATLADDLAWKNGLRGFDAIHLAAALTWQEMLATPITLATFDRQLWQAAEAVGLTAWPERL